MEQWVYCRASDWGIDLDRLGCEGFNRIEEAVDLRFSGARAWRDANAPYGAGADGVMKEGGAVNTASDCDVVVLIELDHNLTGIVPIEIEEDDRSSPFDGRESKDGDARDGLESFEDALGHGHFVLVDLVGECVDGSIEPGKTDSIGGARFEGIGEIGGHFEPGCHRAGAASALAEDASVITVAGVRICPWPDIECAGAGWASESFVTGKGEQVDIPSLNINREVSGSLSRIDKNKGVFVFGADDFDGAFDVLDGAKNIRSVGESEEDGMLSDGVGDCLRIDQALSIAGNNGQVDKVVRCVAVECTEDGIVLDGSGDDMEPGLVGERLHGTAEHAMDGEVERVGASMGEDDAFWSWCMDEVGEFLARVFENLRRFS